MGDDAQARKVVYDRLLFMAKNFPVEDHPARALLQSAKFVLNMNKPGAEAPKEVIENSIISGMPRLHALCTHEYFVSPCFPTVLLRDIAELYGAFKLSDEIIVTLGDDIKNDNNAMSHIWLVSIFPGDVQGNVRNMVTWYRRFIGVSEDVVSVEDLKNIFRAPSQAMQARGSEENDSGVHQTTVPSHQPNPPSSPSPTNPLQADPPSEDALNDVPPRKAGDPAKKAAGVFAYFRDKKFVGSETPTIHDTIRD